MPVLSTADKIYFGSVAADRVYSGSTRVWPSFLPTDYSGCMVWLDAKDLIAGANASAVPAWTNKGGAGQNPTLIGTPAPMLRNPTINSLPVVRQTGGQGHFCFSATNVDRDWTTFIVGRKWGTTKAGRLLSADYGLPSQPNVLFGWWDLRADTAYTEGWLQPDAIVGSDTWFRLYSGDATSTAPARLFTNGVLIRTGAAAPAKGWANSLMLGGFNRQDGNRTEEPDGEYAEVIQYNRKLADAERINVENYLRSKWGVPQRWTPDFLGANLLAWFDAVDSVSVAQPSAGKVSQWHNKGQSAMTLTQPNPAYYPDYFTGNSLWFGNPMALGAANSPSSYDIAVEGTPTSYVALADWRTLLRGTTTAHHVIIENGSSRLGTYNAGFFPAGALTWDNSKGQVYGQFGASPVQLARDGGALVDTGTTLTAPDVAIISFGAYQGPPPSQGFGYVNEVIITAYQSPLATRQLIEGYLAWKHNTYARLPANHPYKNAAP